MDNPVEPFEELRQFLVTALPLHQERWGDDEGFTARRHWQSRLHRNGWVGTSWALEAGGRGLSPAQRVACDLELARAGAPRIAGIIGVNNVGPAIARYGSAAQRVSLAHILSGAEIWCQGFSEPDHGSDLAGLRLRATPSRAGFVLDGAKVWTSNGLDATHCMVLARTSADDPTHRGLSVFLVPMSTPGISVRPIRQLDGRAEFAELHFESSPVSSEGLLGSVGDGWAVAMGTLAHERSGVVALASEVAATMSAIVRSPGAWRSDPALRGRVAAEYIEARVLWFLASRVLAALSAGEDPTAEQSVLKLSWGVRRQASSLLALDLLGPAAMLDTAESAATGMLTARAATIAAGTSEIVKNLLGERVLGLPR